MTRPAKLETYKCGDCKAKTSLFIERCDDTDQFYYEKKVGDKIHEDDVPMHDGSEHHSYCPDWQRDSTYWHKYEREWSVDYIDDIECPHCGGVAGRLINGSFQIKHGRNSHHAKKERMRYATQGMDKKQANKFYEESIAASKERVKTGDQHYAKMVPNLKQMESQGKIKRLSPEARERSRDGLKQANIHMTKDGTIGKVANKKR
jgi:DNA-directed RNA polymerase subunit RPC12/RpoP